MDITTWISLGFMAGWVASLFIGNSKDQDAFTDIIMGMVGASVVGFVVGLIKESAFGWFSAATIFLTILGASVLIWMGRSIKLSKYSH